MRERYPNGHGTLIELVLCGWRTGGVPGRTLVGNRLHTVNGYRTAQVGRG